MEKIIIRILGLGTRSSYAEVVRENPNSGAIDIEADVKTERIVVIGGSGFVGLQYARPQIERYRGHKSEQPLNSLPASDLVLAPPVSVDDAAINAVKDDDCFGIFTIDQIKEAAKGAKV
ncbi:hypothetical protein RND71_040483 [Anisodus tanguticus]|uniref:Uncharacterized protein n=1 Tax=Anisodus tanguticus TaxID=243964 RepID=A0AAE1QT46_9SOLA|nr:hypothetical protein RND71_040483 [Anisodus tanguticus]